MCNLRSYRIRRRSFRVPLLYVIGLGEASNGGIYCVISDIAVSQVFNTGELMYSVCGVTEDRDPSMPNYGLG